MADVNSTNQQEPSNALLTLQPREPHEPADWNVKMLGELLEAGQAAVRRVRLVFVAITIAGILIISAQFNLTIPWLRHAQNRPGVLLEEQKLIREFIFKELYSVSVPILGIKFSGFDLSVIGSIAMLVLAIWFFYCIRRENHVINQIVKAATEERPAFYSEMGNSTSGKPDNEVQPKRCLEERCRRAAYLYHGVVHYFVFTTITDTNIPSGIDSAAEKSWLRRSLTRFAEKLFYILTPRRAVKALLYIPFWVPLSVVAIDVFTLFLPLELGLPANTSLWGTLTNWQRFEALCRCGFASLVSGFSLSWCFLGAEFDRGTQSLMRSLRQFVETGNCQATWSAQPTDSASDG